MVGISALSCVLFLLQTKREANSVLLNHPVSALCLTCQVLTYAFPVDVEADNNHQKECSHTNTDVNDWPHVGGTCTCMKSCGFTKYVSQETVA